MWFLRHLDLLIDKMTQKSPDIQTLKSVLWVLASVSYPVSVLLICCFNGAHTDSNRGPTDYKSVFALFHTRTSRLIFPILYSDLRVFYEHSEP